MQSPDRGLASGEVAISLIKRVSLLVMWAWFAIFHISIVQAGLCVAWYYEVGPTRIAATIAALYHASTTTTLLAVGGLLGLSALAIWKYYVRIWRKAWSSVTTPYVFREIDDHYGRR